MKIAVSSTGEGLESSVDMRFGRCPYFVIIEIENKNVKSVKTIKNEAMLRGGGAGITAAQIIGNEKVEAVITINIGPRAFGVLQQLGINMYSGSGRINDAVNKFLNKELPKITTFGPGGFGRGVGRKKGLW